MAKSKEKPPEQEKPAEKPAEKDSAAGWLFVIGLLWLSTRKGRR